MKVYISWEERSMDRISEDKSVTKVTRSKERVFLVWSSVSPTVICLRIPFITLLRIPPFILAGWSKASLLLTYNTVNRQYEATEGSVVISALCDRYSAWHGKSIKRNHLSKRYPGQRLWSGYHIVGTFADLQTEHGEMPQWLGQAMRTAHDQSLVGSTKQGF